ncbi:MAG: DUF5675 family protein [Chitinophagaceae bacterium]|nr:DUF5675 family protein [Chitinophagaceae bacterium]MDP1763422.1 DUF5675 family protein [Sediminibacterium sp.]
MKLLLQRDTRTNISTIGKLTIEGVFECFILEDKDRGLTSEMPLEEIKEKKVFAQTAIPSGTYEVVITWSDRFKQYMPLLLGVPGYVGIRMHSGKKAADTAGCLITGSEIGENEVINSRAAYRTLVAKLKAAEKKEKIFITIQ